MWVVADLDEDYIAKMEDVLEVYEWPHDPQQPVICLDEKPVTLHADVRPTSPAAPGREARRDNEYERCGTANVFCAVEPKAGRHFTFATLDRSGFEFAQVMAHTTTFDIVWNVNGLDLTETHIVALSGSRWGNRLP